MTNKILTAVSVLALMAATPGLAADVSAKAAADNDGRITIEDAERGLDKTKATLKNTTDKVLGTTERAVDKTAAKTEAAYEDIKRAMVDDQAKKITIGNTTIDHRMTANGIIGESVLNTNGDKIAKVHDIIVDSEGEAEYVVVSDGGFVGIGDKLAAFSYETIVSRQADGDVIMPLTEDSIKKASEFSYDVKDTGKANVAVIPSGGYSMNEILKADLIGTKNQAVAHVENVSFRNGEADKLIVAFDQKLGLGGEKAAIDFDDVQLVQSGTAKAGVKADLDFKLNANQIGQFENYKKSVNN